jgi:tetratricopeptide (TPR) repeat protein
MLFRAWPVCLALACAVTVAGSEPAYTGAATCAQCHRAIAVSQLKSNMALTWQGSSAPLLPQSYSRRIRDGAVEYTVARSGERLQFRVAMPDRAPVTAPVETTVGGRRHGISFLVRLSEIDGLQLPRAPLVEARYLHYAPSNELVLSPGFPSAAPSTYETAIGRVLSPDFERKCLDCHGDQGKGSHETGVRCESCHGPGGAHVQTVSTNTSDRAIHKPSTTEQELELCSKCHAGFSELYDPVPGDLLISSQVTALKRSQCYIQSGGGVRCTSCHDPHRDGLRADVSATAVCQSCHGAAAVNRAALCPVNQKEKCLECHMPVQQRDSFHMIDHWIRVHPEQGVKAPQQSAANRTRVRPKRLYLRLIVAASSERAAAAHAELAAGATFFSVAQKYSTDPSNITGGYIGEIDPDRMDPQLAAAALQLARGEFSPVLDVGGKQMIVARMPRDFLYEAEQLEREGSRLRQEGRLDQAVAKFEESLRVYPQFLRSLVFLGATLGQRGDAQRAAAVLDYATRLYPEDPAARYNLGLAYEGLGRADQAIAAYRKAIELQRDLMPAYLNLGGLLYSTGRTAEADRVYEAGLEQNPLAASLYFNLAQVYRDLGRAGRAAWAAALAGKIDPKYLARTSQPGAHQPQIVLRGFVSRIDANGRFEFRLRFGESPAARQRGSQIAVQIGVAGIE